MADGEQDPAATGRADVPVRDEGHTGFGFGTFVAFIAAIMALTGLSIDSMLPQLPLIGQSLGIPTENHRQWIIAFFMLGFGTAQIIWGPLSDRYGRKPVLVVSLACYAVLSVLAGAAVSFPMLLTVRLLQGIAASAPRIAVTAIVRDGYSGRRMARVMSLAFMAFMVVPIFAPSIGQVIGMIFGSWRSIFFFLAAYGAIFAVIASLRLKETLHPLYRRRLSAAVVTNAFARVIVDRTAIGYTIAAAFSFACISGFIMSVEQIFVDIFHLPQQFPMLFAAIAGTMVFASFFNSRFVERLGTRRISHSALLCFLGVAAIHLGIVLDGAETVGTFVVLQALQMFFFGLLGPNFNAMAMEPVGDIAGSASSVQGFLSTCIGGAIGATIGQLFNGTTLPLTVGFLGCGALALLAVLFAERGRLFRPHHGGPVAA